jgi:DNA topoisomerase-2
VTGIARKVNDTTVEITELPIHKWTQTYKAELEAMIGEKGDGAVKVMCTALTHYCVTAMLSSR